MDKEEILRASRRENKNQDIYEREVLRRSQQISGLVGLAAAFLLLLIEELLEMGANYGYFIIIWSAGAAMFIVKSIKLRRKHEIVLAVLWTIMAVYAVTMYLIKLLG